MYTIDVERAGLDNGLCTYVSEFFTEHLVVQAKLTSPERRLSDHLNGALSTVDVRPMSAQQISTEIETDLTHWHAHLTKARILFVVPITEPERPQGESNIAWRRTVKYRAWGGIGPYVISGYIHVDEGRAAQFALRLLDKPFVPATDVTLTFPDGTTRYYPTLILNQQHLDLLALDSAE
jgi:hypothetical protein